MADLSTGDAKLIQYLNEATASRSALRPLWRRISR
jgi:hypothetical protein